MTLPTGTVTFLFTDIEGSTRLWEQDEAAAREVLVRHDQIIEELVEANEGMLVRPRGEGDSRFAVFHYAPGCVAAAAAIQQAFHNETWPTEEPLKIRMGLHTGHADLREGDYYGSAVNRCARVRSLAHGGQVLLSLATQQLIADYLLEDLVVQDLGVHPLKGLKRPEQIFQLMIPAIPAEFPPLQTRIGPKHNLPEQLTPFVGREPQISAIRELLSQEGIRLVTLKGPGGIGKTRLAIEIASQELERFSAGARFIALAPLDSADQIVQAFLESLDLRPASQEDPKDFLVNYLQRTDLLIVVDNFEHVLDGAPLIKDILTNAPRVKILATSRERLGLRGESVFDVVGLQFADWGTVEQALSDSCTQLFIQGALQVQPEFELEEADVAHMARLCRLVDGAPLALLLSAGWMDVLSLEEIADEVEGSLDILETELQDAPARQRSLRAVFEASWERLEELERELFMKLSVFRGGFMREAAETVANASLRMLARLSDKSFLRREPETGRYEIHEMLRQYSEQRLGEDAAQAAHQAHASYFADMLATKEAELRTGGQAQALDEIEVDIENVRRAVRNLAEAGRAEDLQNSLFSLWAFHEIRGWLHAGSELFTNIEQTMGDSAEERVVAIQLQAIGAWFTIILGFTERGVTTAQRTLEWLGDHGYQNESTYSLLATAVGNIFLQNPSEGTPAALELAKVGAASGNKWWELTGINIAGSGSLAMGDLKQCEHYLKAGAPLRAATGDPWNSFWGGQMRGAIATARGELAPAKEIYRSLLGSLHSVSFLRGMQYTYNNLGRINFLLEELDEAEKNYALSLRISHDTGQIRETLANLTDIATVWKSQGRSEDAVAAVAAVLHHPEIDQHALFRQASIREEAEALRAELEAETNADHYQLAWKKGANDDVDDLVFPILAGLAVQASAN